MSQLIDIVNERFGTDFNQADQLFFDQIIEAAMADDGLRQAAAVNPGDKFELVFKNLLETLFVERMDQNEEIFVRYMNDVPFQKIVTAWMASEAYRRLRSDTVDASQEATPRALPPRLRIVDPVPAERYATCVPLIPLKVAAGAFGDPQHVETAGFSENCEAFLSGLEKIDGDMAAILRENWDVLVAVVREGERDSKTRSEFNSKVSAALDALENTPQPKDGA